MPYTKDDIQKLLNINNQVEKSKITSFYFSLPVTDNLFTGFEQYKNCVTGKSTDYWENLIEYSLNKNLDFIYLLNNPVNLFLKNTNLEKELFKLDKLLIELKKIGVNKLRISEHKLMDYIQKYYPYFIIYGSTSFEFKTLKEYNNFILMHPNVKQIVPSHDLIKNFNLLKNLKIILKDTEIEIMVNEGCIKGCPARYSHAAEKSYNIQKSNNKFLYDFYFSKSFCIKAERENPFICLVKSNYIFPWEIYEYSKIGITNFKLAGRDCFPNKMNSCIKSFTMYLKGIDDIKNIENEPVNTFIHHLSNNDVLKQLKVKEVKNLLPNINHFKKYGELCAAVCGVECRYCDKCAEKIEKVFKKKHEEMKKRTMPVCVITKQAI